MFLSKYYYYYNNHVDLSYYIFENVYYQTNENKWLYYSDSNEKLNIPDIYFSPVEKKETLNFITINQSKEITHIINEPTIVTTTIAGNYSHAIIDHIFPIFCIIKDINLNQKYNLFIDKHKIRKFACAKNIIDFKKREYNNFVKYLLAPFVNETIFQIGLGHNKIFHFKKLIIGGTTNFSRSIWHNTNFLNRSIREYVLNDQYFSINFNIFKNCYLDYFKIIPKKSKYITLCNRKKVRGFTQKSAQNLLSEILKKNYDVPVYNEVLYFENINLEKSIEIMNETKIFITPHGANIANILWMNKNSIIIEIFPEEDKRTIYYNSIADVLDLKYIKFIDNHLNKCDVIWDVSTKVCNILDNLDTKSM